MPSNEVRLELPIRTERQLWRAVGLVLGVRIPAKPCCEHHTTPWRAFADAYFARSPVAVWKGSRGLAGKTYLLGALAMMEAVTLGAEITVLGGSGEQSKRVHEYVAAWTSRDAVRRLLARESTVTETRLKHGGRVKALTASSKSVRGPHPQRLRCDEIDEMELRILDDALGQPMGARRALGPVPQQTVLSSTHQYPSGTMAAILDRAAERGWPVYEWCYRETLEPHGWLARAEVEAKRRVMSDRAWEVEVELQEPDEGAVVMASDQVDAAFSLPAEVPELPPGELVVFEPPADGAAYAVGGDWAKKRDWTVVVVLRVDCTPARLVAAYRDQRRPWPVMVEAYDRVAGLYRVVPAGGRVEVMPGVAALVPAAYDATGVGDVAGDYLRTPAVGIVLVGKARTDVLNRYFVAVEHGELAMPRVEPLYREHRRASVRDVWGRGHLPDTISACAVAWAVRKVALGSVYPVAW